MQDFFDSKAAPQLAYHVLRDARDAAAKVHDTANAACMADLIEVVIDGTTDEDIARENRFVDLLYYTANGCLLQAQSRAENIQAEVFPEIGCRDVIMLRFRLDAIPRKGLAMGSSNAVWHPTCFEPAHLRLTETLFNPIHYIATDIFGLVPSFPLRGCRVNDVRWETSRMILP